jgi:hypothetical protein
MGGFVSIFFGCVVVVFSFVLEVVVEGFLFYYFFLCFVGFVLVGVCVAWWFWRWRLVGCGF